MSNKFTEKQYNMLVEIQEDQYSDDLFFESKSYENSIAYTVAQKYDVLKWFIGTNDLGNEAVALMNPITREWARDKFVEKEKKYVWQSKQETGDGKVKRLYNSGVGITESFKDKVEIIRTVNFITETEVKKWGYIPDMFDKEEVD